MTTDHANIIIKPNERFRRACYISPGLLLGVKLTVVSRYNNSDYIRKMTDAKWSQKLIFPTELNKTISMMRKQSEESAQMCQDVFSQIFPSNLLQYWPVPNTNLLNMSDGFTKSWKELDMCLNCQISVCNKCTGNIWRQFKEKMWQCKHTFCFIILLVICLLTKPVSQFTHFNLLFFLQEIKN